MLNDKNNRRIGLYIHVPFCKSKCLYCDFNSFAGMEGLIEPYFETVKKEILHYSQVAEDCSVKSIFFGGGTPSYVNPRYIYEVMEMCRELLNIEEEAEVSLEANPGTINLEKLYVYKSAGINRLSMGLQAWQDSLLKQIGRIHSVYEFVQNLEAARKAGFDNINVDIIFGLPEQTFTQWEETVEKVLEFKPRHISAYSLKIEDGTMFGEMLKNGKIRPVEDELDRQMYYYAIEKMALRGLEMYEISNFAQEGFQCKHNLIYWRREDYIGIGAGAHSFFNNIRYNNISNINGYIRTASEYGVAGENHHIIDVREAMAEFMILGLRLTEGISCSRFNEEFGKSVFSTYGAELNRLKNKMFIEENGDIIKLSPLGLDLANLVFEEFI